MSLLPVEDAERKALPVFTYLVGYFPKALLEVVRVCVDGNRQHNPERAPEDIVWSRGKSMNQMDTAFRHMLDHASGTVRDEKDGRYHLAKAIWRLSAALQLQIEADEAAAAVQEPSPQVELPLPKPSVDVLTAEAERMRTLGNFAIGRGSGYVYGSPPPWPYAKD